MVSGGEPVSGELESMASVECRGGREERERERDPMTWALRWLGVLFHPLLQLLDELEIKSAI